MFQISYNIQNKLLFYIKRFFSKTTAHNPPFITTRYGKLIKTL